MIIILIIILFVIGILALVANVFYVTKDVRENFFHSPFHHFMGHMPPLVMTDTIVVMP